MYEKKSLLLFICVTLLGAMILTTQFTMAQSGGSDQRVLTLADLPCGTTLITQHALIPNSPNNGYVDKNGRDHVHGYRDGARAEYFVPVGDGLNLAVQDNVLDVHIANYVYRFADQSAAATEYVRLRNDMISYGIPTDVSINVGQAISFEVDDPEGPGLATRATLMHRGPYVVILMMYGQLKPYAGLELPSSSDDTIILTQEWVDHTTAAIDDLYTNAITTLAHK